MKRLTQITLTALAVSLVGLIWTSNVQADHPEEADGCASCHVPHNADADQTVPLWNPNQTTTTLTDNYTSLTMDATTTPGADGASKLCLSCHDGTHPGITTGSNKHFASLATSHPISFVYDQQLAIDDGELVDPTTLAGDILDTNEKMQCTSCHDMHSTAAAHDNLRWVYSGSANNLAFCRNCHIK